MAAIIRDKGEGGKGLAENKAAAWVGGRVLRNGAATTIVAPEAVSNNTRGQFEMTVI